MKEETIKRLEDDLNYAESNDYDKEGRNWGYQEGTIISYNEASDIIKLYSDYQKLKDAFEGLLEESYPTGKRDMGAFFNVDMAKIQSIWRKKAGLPHQPPANQTGPGENSNA